MIDDSLSRKIFVGIVEDNADPKRAGRLKVRVQSIFNNIPVNHIPWSSPQIHTCGEEFNIPAIGKIVNIIFENGNLYSPYYIYTDKYNINLQDKLESLSDQEYKDFVSLLFNHKTQIYSDDKQLTLDYLLNKLTIDKEGINLEIKDNSQRVNIGSKTAKQRVILGDAFLIDWFKEFVNILLNPTSLMGNLGAPIIRPQLDMHLQKFLVTLGDYLSNNVYVVDNNDVNMLKRDSATSEVEHDDVNMVLPSSDARIKK